MTRHAWVRYAAPLGAAWLVYWLAFFPGVVSYDSLNQWSQIEAHKYQNWHPALHTWMLWLLTRAGHSFGTVSLVQVLVTAALVGALVAAARRLGAPAWLAWTAVAWLALSPAVGRGVIAVWKDTAFGAAILWTMVLLLRSVERGGLRAADGLRLGVALALVATLRHNGPATALPALALAAWHHGRAARPALLRAALVALACVVAVEASYRIAHVARTSVALRQEYVIHQIAALVHDGTPLSAADEATLTAFLPLPAWRAAYDCTSVTPLLFDSGLRWKPLRDDETVLWRVWVRLVARNPRALARHWLCASRYLWHPTADLRLGPLPDAASDGMVEPNRFGIAPASALPAVAHVLARLITWTLAPGSVLRILFWQPATALYVLVVAVAVATFRTRSTAPLVVFAPPLFNTAGLLVVAASAEARLQWPVMLAAPLAACFAAADWPASDVLQPARAGARSAATEGLGMGRRALVLVAALLVGCGGHEFVTRKGAERSVVIRNVRVFDARGGVLMDGLRDVVVRDGRIAAVGGTGADARGLAEVDGHGGTLLPGLVDVHVHTGASTSPPWRTTLPQVDENLGAYLYAGTTTALDVGGLTPAVFRLRDQIRVGQKLGPHLYAAGPLLTSPNGHPANLMRAWLPWYLRGYVVSHLTRELATPADAERAVTELLAEQPDVLKIAVDSTDGVPLAPDVIATITKLGHAHGVRTVAHIGSSADALAAVHGGVDALFHEPYLEEVSDEAVAAIAAAHLPVVVTLAVWDSVERLGTLSAKDLRPIEREVLSADVIAGLGAAPDSAGFRDLEAQRQKIAAAHAARRRSVAKLRAAGITILAGSDAANPGNAPGAALDAEVEKLVEAGMTPGEALHTATWENAHFLAGEGAEFGEVAPGKRADLLLVAGDPLADVTALERVAGVWLEGSELARHPRPVTP